MNAVTCSLRALHLMLLVLFHDGSVWLHLSESDCITRGENLHVASKRICDSYRSAPMGHNLEGKGIPYFANILAVLPVNWRPH